MISYTIKNEIKTVLQNSQEIKDFVSDKYNSRLSIFAGMDFNNPPTEDETPFVSIHMNRQGGLGDDDSNETWSFLLGCAIVNENTEVDNELDYDSTDYVGVDELDDFMNLVNTALKTLPNPLKAQTTQLTTEDTVYYPLFIGALEITISAPKTLGGFSSCII